MSVLVGLQLYTLRQQLASNFEKTLELVALAGYRGVELAGLHHQKPEKVALLLNNLSLKLVAMHCDVISAGGLQRSLDEAEALNCPNLICPWCPPETFQTEKNIRQLSEKLNDANRLIIAQGKNLLYHNHDFEFCKLNEQSAFNIFANHLDPTIHFELDVYLAKAGGANPVELMNFFHDRIEMLHLKDGRISPPSPNTTVGDGNMNYTTIFRTLPPSVNWFFVEIENCETDMMEAVRKSAEYCNQFLRF